MYKRQGYQSLFVSNSGNNTALGYWAGRAVTGTDNTLIGTQSGMSGSNNLTSGSNNTLIGHDAAASSATVSNEVTIGDANVTRLRVPGIGLDLTSAPLANIVEDTSPQLGGVLDAGTQNIIFADSNGSNTAQLRFGANADLKIFHDGTDNIFQSTGLRTFIFKPKDTDIGLKIVGDGGCELYYDNNRKFHTISAGCQVTGNIYVNDGNTFTAGGNNDGQFFHNGTDTYFQNSTGKLRIRNTHADEIKLDTNSTTRWNVGSSGHIYPDANNTYDIGTSSYRVRNLYTNDLNLSNEGTSNDVDGTWGSYTIQELSLIHI